MSKVPALLAFFLGLTLLWLAACNSLWSPFQGPNPESCVATPGSCAEGEVCNSQTRRCGVPGLDLVAGGIGGAGNADDTGADARFNAPNGVSADGAGNLYVADRSNHTIRKVVVSTGVVTTIAGTAGLPGTTDGTGAAARFNNPSGVALDGAGNLYVADSSNHKVRKVVVSTGAVTTIAGVGTVGSMDGMGASAQFNQPYDVVLDGTGNLYVADTLNHTIRKVVLSSPAVVSTLAGTAGTLGSADGMGTLAQFNQPQGLAADGAGNLYVADRNNHTIRKLVLGSPAVVSTLAGTANLTGNSNGTGNAARFNQPYDVALDGAGNLYVADSFNNRIRKIVVSTGVVTTIAGSSYGNADGTGAAARFGSPFGVALDGTDNLYVAEGGNHKIRKVVVSASAVTTIAGRAGQSGSADDTGAAARFSSPFGVAGDGAGNLYIADYGNYKIRQVVLSTGAVTTIAGATGVPGSDDGTGATAKFSSIRGIAADGAGNLYVVEKDIHTIRQVVVSTGEVTTIAGATVVPGVPSTPGSTDGTGNAARFSFPYGLALDGAGNLYVADSGNHRIRKVVVSTGTVTTIAGSVSGSADGTGAAAMFKSPQGVAADGIGNLYVADTGNHTVRKVVVSTGAVTTIAGGAGMSGSIDGTGNAARFSSPYDVAADSAGNLYVADFGNYTIRKIELATAVVTTVAGIAGQAGVKLGLLPGRLSSPNRVAVLPSGEIIMSIPGENAILALR